MRLTVEPVSIYRSGDPCIVVIGSVKEKATENELQLIYTYDYLVKHTF